MSIRKGTNIVPLSFQRPDQGPSFAHSGETEFELSGAPGWRSNGGPTRGHPARSFPFTLDAHFDSSQVVRIHLVGVFALYAGPELEVPGTLGASIQLFSGDAMVHHQELTNGLHYSDASNLSGQFRTMGDGSSIAPVGVCRIEQTDYRVDVLTFDISNSPEADQIKFKTLASPASFVIFDVFAEVAAPHGCPFHSSGGGVPLARIGSIVRVGDRVEFAKALGQLERGIAEAAELDEARGQALTFLAVLTAALLETGGSKKLMLDQLEAARELEHCTDRSEVWASAAGRVEKLSPTLVGAAQGPSDRLVDKALAYVERNYARSLTDAAVARHLGLSTSHFRYLFRQATGQPFHKYVIAARLEKAHQLLMEMEPASVGTIAKAVGFAGLSHFSRAFTQRFSVSPANVRRNRV